MKILKCFSKGMTDLEIGTELEMENAAIAKHSDAIMRKLRVDSRSDAVLRAVQAKLI
jgi:DNA-binding NarL/FixJ family response regulator